MLKWIVIVFLFSTWAEAGFVKENGGNSIVCVDSSENKTVHFLDFFEAKQAPDFMNFTNLNTKSQQQALDGVMQILKPILGDYAFSTYQKNISSFLSETYFLKNGQLDTVPDSYHFIVPKNCRVEQTVIQIDPLFNEARYTINFELWSQLSAADQAGLMMHELIYRDLGTEDSRQVRMITAFLFSDEILKLNLPQRIEFLKKMKFIDRYN